MLVQVQNRCYVNTDMIRAIRKAGDLYEVYVDSPDYIPYVATIHQFLKIDEAMNDRSN